MKLSRMKRLRANRRREAEAARSSAPVSPRKGPVQFGAWLLTGSFALAQMPVYAGGSLPTPCPGTSAACKGLSFDKLNTGSTLNYGANNLTINQNASSAIFNWQSFNISAGNTVQFIQPSASSVALNRIFDPNVTSIYGNLLANGQIYLINPNGVLFGSGANVNVGGLIASTSNISDQRLTKGLLSDPSVFNPVFTNNPALVGTDLGPSSTGASIVVQPGATLYAAGRNTAGSVVSAGRVFLFAPTVESGGSIKVDGGGQVILASGSDIYLGSSTDASLRGLLVEVTGSNAAGVTVDATGSIQVNHGNITLMGLAVNQNGRLTATSALDANGSIRLIARTADPTNTTLPPDPTMLLQAAQTGSVVLGSGSQTVVRLDPSDTATLPLNDPTAASLRSTIDIQGAAVQIGGNGSPGSTLVEARGGGVTVTARQVSSVLGVPGIPSPPLYTLGDGGLLGTANPSSVINVGADASIDVSGLQNVAVAGDRNFVFIDRLTSSNLANAPYQRNGFLLGQSVYLNLATAPSWIDVSNLQAAVAGTQAERNANAGTIALRAEGGVNLAKGSVLNVSGGSIDVTAALGRTSRLITATGQVVDISNASPDVQYVGFADHGSATSNDPFEGINQTTSWQAPAYALVGGYSQGGNAGTIEIYAPTATLAGTMLGQTTVAPQQRAAPPLTGQLKIGSDNAAILDSEAAFSRADIVLGGLDQQLQQQAAAAGQPAPIVLDTSSLIRSGITRLDLTSDGTIELASNNALNLGARGALVARANQIQIDSSIQAPGGTVQLSERGLTPLPANVLDTNGLDASSADEARARSALSLVDPASSAFGSVRIAPATSISVAGLWTNDRLLLPAQDPPPIVLNGGTISISGRTVDVSASRFDVSAGATLPTSGQFSGGAGGSLSLTAAYRDPLGPQAIFYPGSLNGSQAVDTGTLDLGAAFASRVTGFGVTQGGSLTLMAASLQLGTGDASLAPALPAGTAATVVIDPAIGARGFQSFKLAGYDSVAVAGAATFAPKVLSIQNSVLLDVTPSSAGILSVATPQAPLPGQVAPARITLTASAPLDGTVSVGKGATIDAGVTGSVTINADSNVTLDGTLRAPAGSVGLALVGWSDATAFAPGQIASRSIQLGQDATIDVSGASLAFVNPVGLKFGNVLNGGTVTLDGTLGSVAMQPGARLLASGALDTVDIPVAGAGYRLESIASSGGTVEVSATNAIYLEGTAAAYGGDAGAAGGRLSVALLAPAVGSNPPPGFNTPDTLTIGDSLPPLNGFQASFNPGGQAYLPPSLLNSRSSGFDQVWAQSPDLINFAPANASNGIRLAVNNSLVLSAQAIGVVPTAATGASVQIDAPYVSVGTVALLSATQPPGGTIMGSNAPVPAASGGTATLDVNATRQINLAGNLYLQNIGSATLTSNQDIQAIGIGSQTGSARTSGSINFAGNVTLSAAQVFPATQTDYQFNATAAAGDTQNGILRIQAGPSGTAPLPPLSAGGSLTFNVGDFQSSGTVLAPLGQIAVSASRSIELASGSVISVAGDALVPFGTVSGGTLWTYGLQTGNTSVPLADFTVASSTGVTITSIRPKSIALGAPTIDAQPGSKINIAGGGDLLGTEFVAGPGGSYDMSLNFPYTSTAPTTRNPYFALVPSRATGAAPYDTQIYSDLALNPAMPGAGSAGFQVGQTITIGGGSAIPAGTYTILPPRYALLPGAFAVEAAGGFQDMLPGTSVAMPDGTLIVAGKLGFAAAGTADSRWSGFRVYSDAQFRTLSEFHDFLASTYFTSADANAGVPADRVGPDAGSLQIDTVGSIRLAGAIDAAPQGSGRGADIAIDAPSIAVTDSTVTASAPQSTLQIAAATLTGLGAETLVLGATETRNSGVGSSALALSNPSQSVTVQASSPLSAGEVVLVGSNVTVVTGSTVSFSASQTPPTTAVSVGSAGTPSDGALLYVGNVASAPSYTRVAASPAGAATSGTLSIGDATISGQSVIFDATQSQSYGPSLALKSSNTNLSAALVDLGNVPAGTAGLDLTAGLLSQMSASGNLTITSPGGFDVYGSATIGALNSAGAPQLDRLTLVGPGIAGFGDATGQFEVNAGHVSLDNRAGSTMASTGTGLGRMTLNSTATPTDDGSIEIAGSIAISGFQAVGLSATGRAQGGSGAPATVAGTGDLRFDGSAGATAALSILGTGASLSVDATRITAQRGVNASILVPGTLTMAASGPASAPQTGELGASLQIQAQNVDLSGRIDLPAGVVQIDATGSATTDGIALDAGSSIRVAGLTQSFASTTADVSAGSIGLNAANGSVTMQSGATLDLQGAGSQGDAGALSVSAPNGSVALLGGVLSAPGTAARGVDIWIEASQLGNFSALAQTIAAGGGGVAADSISLRARSGNIAVAASDVLQAHTITLEADGAGAATDGSLTIGGQLNATGPGGGQINLYANDQTVLQAGALLDAHATGAAGTGGQVLISSRVTANAAAPASLDAIVLQSGSQINVSGGASGSGGLITLRANANSAASPTDVEIAALPAGSLIGARQNIVEGVIVDSTGPVVDAGAVVAGYAATLSGYMSSSNRAAITQRLLGTTTPDPTFSLRPGLEIRSSGDITVARQIDFAAGLTSTNAAACTTCTYRYVGTTAASDPGDLTLRAAGNLNVNANLSDGFSPTAATATVPNSTVWTAGQSWSYTLAAGADLSASNPNRVIASAAAADPNRTGSVAGQLTIGTSAARPVTVRTGTGSIALDAGGDVLLGNGNGQAASDTVYTAGVANVTGLALPALFQRIGLRTVVFPYALTQGGGDLSVQAGGDVLGPNGGGSTQASTSWLLRGGFDTAAAPTLWWINFASFQQGFGALGGGNLSVAAGRNVAAGAVVPSNGYAAGAVPSEWNTGSLKIAAGGAIQQGYYYDEAGTFELRAGSIAPGPAASGASVVVDQGSNLLDVQARESITMNSPGNPLAAWPPSATNAGITLAGRVPFESGFYTYTGDSAFSFRTAAGDLTVNPAGSAAPPSMQLVAFGGTFSTTSNIQVTLYPAPNGQMRVLADGSITDPSLVMSQSDPTLGPTVLAPYTAQQETQNQFSNWLTLAADIFNGGGSLHAGDPNSAEIVSRTGSLSGAVVIPKTAEIAVGGNIDSAQIQIQNSNANSMTRISAGQQIVEALGATSAGIQVGGPGVAEITAGGPIDLGINGPGIVSRGNLDNPNLAAVGASLIVTAGAGREASGFAARPDYVGVIDNFVHYDAFASSGSGSAALDAQVLAALSKDPSLQPLVNALSLGLADRASASNPQSAFNQALAQLTPAQLAVGAVKLASAVQVAANGQFVGSKNRDTFAPAYAVFGDLFPNLNNNAGAIRQFVSSNPFANAPNGSALQRQALAGLPSALSAAISLGLSAPATVTDPNSAFSKALAALDPATLSDGARQLFANVLQVAGSSLDALRASGGLVGSGTPYAKALTAFAASFAPATQAGLNDLNMAYNEINVQQTGDVAMFTPQGGVIVGQSSPPPFASGKTAAELGIFTYGGGDVIGMARDNFDVFRSRVFTVAGGDIDLWSSLENIDAGRGARDVAVVPPPQIVTDSNGIQHIALGATVTGSGIGALETEPDQPPSNINLMAPAGYIDAGEAGIRAQTGQVVLGTNLVLNAGNIQAASGISGGAVVATPPPPPPPSTSTTGGDRAAEEAQREAIAQQQAAAQAAADQRRFRVTGEFIGFGPLDCDSLSNPNEREKCESEKKKPDSDKPGGSK